MIVSAVLYMIPAMLIILPRFQSRRCCTVLPSVSSWHHYSTLGVSNVAALYSTAKARRLSQRLICNQPPAPQKGCLQHKKKSSKKHLVKHWISTKWRAIIVILFNPFIWIIGVFTFKRILWENLWIYIYQTSLYAPFNDIPQKVLYL